MSAIRMLLEALGALTFISVCLAAAFGFWQAWLEHKYGPTRDEAFIADFPEFDDEPTPLFDSVVEWEQRR